MQQVYQQQLLHQQQQYQQLQAMQAAQKTVTTGTLPTSPPTSQPANNTLPNGPAPNLQAANGEQLQNGDDDGEGSVIVKDDNGKIFWYSSLSHSPDGVKYWISCLSVRHSICRFNFVSPLSGMWCLHSYVVWKIEW